MSTNITLESTLLDEVVDYIVDKCDAGSGAATLTIMDLSETTLGVLTMSDPAFGASSGGVATANAITKCDAAVAAGIAALYKVEDSDSNEVFRGDVGLTGSDSALQLDDVDIAVGDDIDVTAFTFTLPNS